MGSRAVGRVALLSIHPHYADGICRAQREWSSANVHWPTTSRTSSYTRPRRSAALWVRSRWNGQHTLAPEELWDRFAQVGGIDADAFAAYYAGGMPGRGLQSVKS